MQFDSSGKVGIGTSSPSNKLTVSGSAGLANGITSFNGAAFTRIYGDATHGGNVNWNTGGTLRFATSADDFSGYSELMRLDSSGNLLVGTTNADPAGADVAGTAIGSTGYLSMSRSGGAVGIFNRKTNDGNILEFNKDGSQLGRLVR